MENAIASVLLALRLFILLALYTFLAWALITMWRDLNGHIAQLEQKRTSSIQLHRFGQDSAQGERFHQQEIVIGRHPSNHWPLEDETVSSRHARLIFHHEQWWLEDLDSRNGTFLNEERLIEPIVIKDEDEVRCGQARFVISLAESNMGGSNG